MPSAQGARLAFGEALEPIYHLDKADVILALDADFLAWGPDTCVMHATLPRGARARRTRTNAGPSVNRLYAIECTPSLTGAMADHRLAVPARDVKLFAQAVAHALKIDGVTGGHIRPDDAACVLDLGPGARP